MAAPDAAPIDPDQILRRSFSSVRKGFDPVEVQKYLLELATELKAAAERERDLRHRLDSAEKQVAELTELAPSRLTSLVGEETARVLAAANAAAQDIRTRAEENVARLVREAQDEASELRRLAETALERETAKAQEAAEAVGRKADEVLQQARVDADAEMEAGRQRGREMVTEAQRVRERMLRDLARRRKLLRQQIEQLQAGRERLAAAYDVVRETLDTATEELRVVVPEAKLAAEAAALRAEEAQGDEPFERELAALSAEIEAEAGAGTAPATPAEPAGPTDGGDAEGGAATEDAAPEEAAPEGRATDGGASDGAGDADAAQDAGDAVQAEPTPKAPDPEEGRRSSAVNVIRADAADAAPADEPEAVDEPADAGTDVADPPADAGTDVAEVGASDGHVVLDEPPPDEPDASRAEPDAFEAELVASQAEPDEPEGPEAGHVEAGHADERGGGPAGNGDRGDAPSSKVADLFARMKQETGQEASSAAAHPGPVEPSEAGDVEPADDAEEGTAAGALGRRDAAVAGIVRQLTRRIKRELSDEQNELLDAARRQASPDAEDLLPPPEAHVERYASVVHAGMAEAVAAGAAFVGAPVGTAPAQVRELGADLAAELVAPLRDRLERAFAEAGDDPDELAERLRACYREWKTQRVDPLTDHAALAAFNRGVLDGVDPGVVVRWLVDDDGHPSPDCEDNALADDVVPGAPFPTGHAAPPAHPSCRCLVVPVTVLVVP